MHQMMTAAIFPKAAVTHFGGLGGTCSSLGCHGKFEYFQSYSKGRWYYMFPAAGGQFNRT
jgi:hypothetical protein